MSLPQPPSRATRMMRRASIDPAIVGDLIEEYSNGRSSLWFWIQAVGALLTKAPGLSRYVVAFRWAVALPLAMLSVRLMDTLILAFPLHFVRDYSHTAVLAPGASFLMAWAFLTIAVVVAPSRRDLVARIGLAVVAGSAIGLMKTGSAWGVSSLLGLTIFFGMDQDKWTIAMGLSAMLGAGAASIYEIRKRGSDPT